MCAAPLADGPRPTCMQRRHTPHLWHLRPNQGCILNVYSMRKSP